MENIANSKLNKNMKQFEIQIDSRLFSKEAINATAYKYSGTFYIQQSVNNADNSKIDISFTAKENTNNIAEHIINDFHNDLIDQQLRYETNKQFGHIRNLIVEEAFKPVNSKK